MENQTKTDLKMHNAVVLKSSDIAVPLSSITLPTESLFMTVKTLGYEHDTFLKSEYLDVTKSLESISSYVAIPNVFVKKIELINWSTPTCILNINGQNIATSKLNTFEFKNKTNAATEYNLSNSDIITNLIKHKENINDCLFIYKCNIVKFITGKNQDNNNNTIKISGLFENDEGKYVYDERIFTIYFDNLHELKINLPTHSIDFYFDHTSILPHQKIKGSVFKLILDSDTYIDLNYDELRNIIFKHGGYFMRLPMYEFDNERNKNSILNRTHHLDNDLIKKTINFNKIDKAICISNIKITKIIQHRFQVYAYPFLVPIYSE